MACQYLRGQLSFLAVSAPGGSARVIVVCLSEISQTGGGLMTIDMPTTAP